MIQKVFFLTQTQVDCCKVKSLIRHIAQYWKIVLGIISIYLSKHKSFHD